MAQAEPLEPDPGHAGEGTEAFSLIPGSPLSRSVCPKTGDPAMCVVAKGPLRPKIHPMCCCPAAAAFAREGMR